MAVSIISWGQPGSKFPALEGEMLDGSSRTLPSYISGKLSIVGMAYSEKSEDALRTWYSPMYDKFVLKRGIFDGTYDVHLVFVPMYIGLKQVAYASTLKQLKESNRKDLYPYILFYKGELEPYGTSLSMEDKNLPYFFVLDPEGRILDKITGIFTESKMERIEKALDDFMEKQ